MIVVVGFIVWVERSERRIPVQYAKRVVGRKVMGGQSTHLPLRVNAGGVMPVIFASSILTLPQTDRYSFKDHPLFRRPHPDAWDGASRFIRCCTRSESSSSRTSTFRSCSIPAKSPTTCASTADLSPAFVRDAHGGLHQRSADADYAGGRAVPDHHFVHSRVDDHRYSPESPSGPSGRFFERMPTWVTNGLGVNFYFGGTSLLIVVGVAMDTVTQIEAQLIMRHYDGFTPRSGRIRGRRMVALRS